MGLGPLALAGPPRQGLGQAPDGAPGFGKEPTLRSVEKLWRKGDGEQAGALLAWKDLPARAHLHECLFLAEEERRGLGALVRRRVPLADRLEGGATAALLAALVLDPFPRGLDPDEALAFVRSVGSARRNAQVLLLEEAAHETAQLRAAHALLDAHTFGLGRLEEPGILVVICQRADLSAARLRALLRDLEALADAPSPIAETDPTPVRLAQAIHLGDRTVGLSWSEWIGAASKATEVLLEGTATAAFDRLYAPQLDAREQQQELGRTIARELGPLVAETAHLGVLNLGSRSLDGAREGLSRALTGLAGDPLNPELNRQAGLLGEAVLGRPQALPWMDRALHLMGIRAYDDWTVTGRSRTPEQQDLLTRILTPPGSTGG